MRAGRTTRAGRRVRALGTLASAAALVATGCLADRFGEGDAGMGYTEVPLPPAAAHAGAAAPPMPMAGMEAPPMPPPDGTHGGSVTFTDMERALARTLSPLGAVPADTTNAHADDPAAAALGQLLFFDAGFSGPLNVASEHGALGETGRISCATCHWGPALDDPGHNVSTGADHHARNSPTVINSAFHRWVGWGGRFSAQWEVSLAVAESPVLMNADRLHVVHRLFDVYAPEYEAAFGALDPAFADFGRFPAHAKPKPAPTDALPTPPDGAWEAMTDADREAVNRVFVNYGKALEAYLRLLVSRNAPFDRFVAGDAFALGEDAQRGLQLFVGRGRCVNCHSGPNFSDDAFHALGVPQIGELVPLQDDGRHKDIPLLLASAFHSATGYSDNPASGRLAGLTNPPPEDTRGQFRTPGLRGVAGTAPYMHAGQLATLRDVIDFHDRAAQGTGLAAPLLQPLYLSEQDKADLVAFLESLTGDPVPAELLDPNVLEMSADDAGVSGPGGPGW